MGRKGKGGERGSESKGKEGMEGRGKKKRGRGREERGREGGRVASWQLGSTPCPSALAPQLRRGLDAFGVLVSAPRYRSPTVFA